MHRLRLALLLLLALPLFAGAPAPGMALPEGPGWRVGTPAELVGAPIPAQQGSALLRRARRTPAHGETAHRAPEPARLAAPGRAPGCPALPPASALPAPVPLAPYATCLPPPVVA